MIHKLNGYCIELPVLYFQPESVSKTHAIHDNFDIVYIVTSSLKALQAADLTGRP